jgi:hypothetical protein
VKNNREELREKHACCPAGNAIHCGGGNGSGGVIVPEHWGDWDGLPSIA